MSPLPWLLDWPPSRAALAAFLLLTALSSGTVLLFGGGFDDGASETVTVESTDLTVRLNDGVDYPDATNGSVQTCVAVGTPGDSVSVLGDVTVDVPPERGLAGDRHLTVAVSLGHTDATDTGTIEGPGTVTRDVFWVFADDETLSVGDTARLQIRVRSEGETVANATREVTVENGTRSFDC